MNSIALIGNLTRDPEIKAYKSGDGKKAMLIFTIAVNCRDGGDSVLYMDVTAFGKLAENCNKSLKKGHKVAVEGELGARTYQNKAGNSVTAYRIRANSVDFLTPKEEAKPAPAPVEQFADNVEIVDDTITF